MSFRGLIVFGEAGHERQDHVVEDVFVKFARQLHTVLEGSLLERYGDVLNSLQLLSEHPSLVPQLVADVLQVAWVLQKLLGFVRTIHENPLEVVTRPLDCVLDLVGEVFQGAERNALFRRVNAISIALGQFWKDNL